MPVTAITVHSKPSVPRVSRDAASAAVSMRKYWIRCVRTQQTEPYKKALRKRQVWVEPLFAEGKDWHGMRRFRLRRLWRVNCEALMRAAGQNLKRLLKKRGWGRRPFPGEAVFALLLASWWWLTRLFSQYQPFTR
jgi:hypothetical protein